MGNGATPIDGEYIDLWPAVDPKGPVKLGRIGQLPSWISNSVVPKLLLHELELEVMKDADIWKHQRYVHRPMLSKGDRDVNRFRKYCEQFYPENTMRVDASVVAEDQSSHPV